MRISSIVLLLATAVAVAAGRNVDATNVTPEEMNAITKAQQGNPNFASVLTNSTLLAKLGSAEQQRLILPNMPPELPPIPAPPAPPAVGPCAEWGIPLVTQKTLWSDFVYWDNVLPDYPRPHLRRNEYSWLNLNGRWEFQGTDETTQPPFNQSLQQCILVPFPMESDLSGIRRHYNYSFYRRTFRLPAAWNPIVSRVILHSTRVDWEASYYVNGAAIGMHRGGYDAHSFDITEAATTVGVNEIIVRVADLTEAGPNQPLGKQRSFDKGGDRIVYTSVSGIWGSIWLEAVPAASYIVDVEAFTDLDSGIAKFTLATSNTQQIGQTRFTFSLNNQTLGPITNITYQAEDDRTISYWVNLGPVVQSWSPDSPNQYTVNITINSGDFVMLDFAFHKIEKSRGSIPYLRFNNEAKATFLLAPLYQGYFPDGLYTMTTPQQAKAVIDIIKSVGFNAVRVHGKVENPWFFHFADKQGLYILQDIPSPCGLDPTGTADGKPVALPYFTCWTLEKNSDWNADSLAQFQTEVAAIVRETRKHPSIIAYVAYNEGWGELPEEVPNTMQLISSLAPNKLVNEASGWVFHGSGDFVDIHQYMDAATFAQNADPTSVNNTLGFSPDQQAFQQSQPDAAAHFVNKIPVIGEFGGVGRWMDQHVWKNLSAADVCVYNCDVTIDDVALTDRILAQFSVIAARAAEGKAAGAVYTQLNDVENEVNGIWTYDFQRFKLTSLDALKEMFDTIQNNYAQAVKF